MPMREPAPGLVRFERSELKHPPVKLTPAQRAVCERTVIEACQHYPWNLKELHIRTEHLHVVLIADRTPEFVSRSWTLNGAKKNKMDAFPDDSRPCSAARPSGSARADSSITRSLTVALLTGGATGGRVADIDVGSATVRERAKDSNARRDMLYQGLMRSLRGCTQKVECANIVVTRSEG